MNKRASVYTFVYVMAFGFLLAIIYLIFTQILTVYIYPTTEYLVNGTTPLGTTVTTAKADKFLGFWQMIPFVLIFLLIFYLFIESTRKSDNPN